jgi:hypothetical protein
MLPDFVLARNLNRMVCIRVSNVRNNPFSFLSGGARGAATPPEIVFCVIPGVMIPVSRMLLLPFPPVIDTFRCPRGLDIALFHEMLHWFHCLRDCERFSRERLPCSPDCYQYLSRCYYGDESESFTWCCFKHEEMRTILGAPNYNIPAELALLHPDTLLQNDPGGGIAVSNEFLPLIAKFHEGDDLSENAYRMARHTVANPVRMRFGHGGCIKPISILPCMFRRVFVSGLNVFRRWFGYRSIVNIEIPARFRLAHLVATTCCNAIVGAGAINNWDLVSGEAVE